jgi:large subunit ribosomal protein L17
MRHGKRGRYLSRNSSHRTSLYRNLTLALLSHEKITTTIPKAKELRPYIERLITLAKRGVASGDKAKSLHARRLIMARLGPVAKVDLLDAKGEPTGENVIGKIFNDLAVRYAGRTGGYTRILKLTKRRLGDAGETAVIELLKEGETKVTAKEKDTSTPTPAPAPAPVPVATGENV